LFRRASREYLNGNWIKAEQLLTHLIRLNARDVDAQLMLASLLRRTGQLTEASGRLRRLEATDGAEKWRSEIARERHMLEGQFTKHQNVENAVTETPEAKAA
jgi:cytochrome c-type biogenesis protein CcmH/NrfG